MIPPEREELVREMFADPDGRYVPSTREADVMTAAGERLRVIWNNNLVRDPEGRVVNVVCTGTDVTSERDTTAVLRHLLEAPVATALVGLDERGRISVFNQGAQELLHRTPEDVLGRHVSEIVVSPQPERYLADAAAQPARADPSAERSRGCARRPATGPGGPTTAASSPSRPRSAWSRTPSAPPWATCASAAT